MGPIIWDRETAEVYDTTYRAMFGPSVLGPVVDLLAGLARGGLARGGPALEFAVGTGRVAAADAAVSAACRHLARTLPCGSVQAGNPPAVIIALAWHLDRCWCGRARGHRVLRLARNPRVKPAELTVRCDGIRPPGRRRATRRRTG